MTDIDLRWACLELAATSPHCHGDVVADAGRFYDFVQNETGDKAERNWQPGMSAYVSTADRKADAVNSEIPS